MERGGAIMSEFDRKPREIPTEVLEQRRLEGLRMVAVGLELYRMGVEPHTYRPVVPMDERARAVFSVSEGKQNPLEESPTSVQYHKFMEDLNFLRSRFPLEL